ncbi:DUF4262 domain-containing protein [Candidatus Woesearchaeota archaeon]|nr:DUF4262 domain-containing protein [Bacteroidota bacterium]MBT4207087.1 DUF4262 domain-containing protein [Candidatus Woesearchaeota archaeon]
MKNKIESATIIETLVQRFQNDKVSSEMRATMEDLFMEGNLGNEAFSKIFPFQEEDIICDPPDGRIQLLYQFYESINQHGINIFPGHSESRKSLIENIDNLIRLEQSLSPFIIVEHSLKEHLAFLRKGIFDIGWDLYTFPGDRMASNGKIAEFLHFEAKRFGFGILEISVKDRKMKLNYSGELNTSSAIEVSNNPNISDITAILNESKPSFGSHLEGFILRTADDAHDIKVLSDVKEYGFHIVWIKSEGLQPDYGFTIGLEYSYEHPEIILMGLPIGAGKNIINKLGAEIKKGQKFIDSDDYIKISSQKFMVKKMDPSNYGEYIGYFMWFYRSLKTPPAVMQLFWPDESDKFPWDDGFNEKFLNSQPLLYKKLSS